MFGGLVGDFEDFAGDEAINICPVSVGNNTSANTNVGGAIGVMDPVLHQMIKNLKAPHFDDTAENWSIFIWEFNDYLQKLSPTKPILDVLKLRLFEDSMPEVLRAKLN